MNKTYTGDISLRDYFAAKAMQAIISGPECQLEEMKYIAAHNGEGKEATIAHFSYKQADAMLTERNRVLSTTQSKDEER